MDAAVEVVKYEATVLATKAVVAAYVVLSPVVRVVNPVDPIAFCTNEVVARAEEEAPTASVGPVIEVNSFVPFHTLVVFNSVDPPDRGV